MVAEWWGLIDRMHARGRICNLVYGLVLVKLHLGPRVVPAAGITAVQHGSTATHPDADGLAGTREDGDLHRDTRVDVLPPDGMQEVSGSSPLSSTGQEQNSNESNRRVQQESTATAAGWAAICVFGLGTSAAWGCWHDTGFQALNRRLQACHLGKSQSRRSRDFCCLITTRPSWRAIPASDCCHICK